MSSNNYSLNLPTRFEFSDYTSRKLKRGIQKTTDGWFVFGADFPSRALFDNVTKWCVGAMGPRLQNGDARRWNVKLFHKIEFTVEHQYRSKQLSYDDIDRQDYAITPAMVLFIANEQDAIAFQLAHELAPGYW